MTPAIIGILIGLAVGAFNYWLLRSAVGAAAWQEPSIWRGIGGRMLIRNVANLAALFLVYVLFRNQWVILSTFFGLLVFPAVTVIQTYNEGRARRR